MTTYQKLSELRKDSGLSQEELAERMEVSRQTISRWENGNSIPSAENLTKLSEIFQVPAQSLLWDDWVPPEEPPGDIQEELPGEIREEPPGEIPKEPVPNSRPKRRLLILIAAVFLAAGILIGLFARDWYENRNTVLSSELEGEVIDPAELMPPIEPIPFE